LIKQQNETKSVLSGAQLMIIVNLRFLFCGILCGGDVFRLFCCFCKGMLSLRKSV
jgi:hypothetical protein